MSGPLTFVMLFWGNLTFPSVTFHWPLIEKRDLTHKNIIKTEGWKKVKILYSLVVIFTGKNKTCVVEIAATTKRIELFKKG